MEKFLIFDMRGRNFSHLSKPNIYEKTYSTCSLLKFWDSPLCAETALAVKRAAPDKQRQLISEMRNELSYLQNSDDFVSVNIVEIGALESQVRDGALELDLPKIGRIRATTKNLDLQTASNFVWEGETSDSQVILAHDNGRTYGQIRKDGRVFDIQYLENGYATFIEYNKAKLNKTQCGAGEIESTKPSELNKKSQSTNNSSTGVSISSSSSPLVRVLCLFTPAARATGMNMTDIANTARNQWLTAQINSSVSPNLQIAAVQELNFVENSVDADGDNDMDLDDDIIALRNNLNAQQLRDQFEADIVILLTNGVYPGLGGKVAQIGPRIDDAYGIVQVANATSTITWVHEVAHLFGARHQVAVDDTPGDAHGHGWQTGALFWIKRYGSIMHTLTGNRERVFHFSNPNKVHNGKPTGVAGESFNARVINVNGPAVSEFRFTRPDVTAYIYGPGLANDGDVLLFTSAVSNASGSVNYRWEANTGGGYFQAGTSSSLYFTMPTDQDLNIRLSVTDSEGRTATDIHFVRNSFLDGGPCVVCPDSTTLDFAAAKPAINALHDMSYLVLFPNPSSDFLELNLPEDLFVFERVEILTSAGAIVSELPISRQNLTSNFLKIDIRALKPGSYILRLSGARRTYSSRFVKK